VSRYDLLIIGGGVNGLGIAADASARGLSVLLVEKGDFGGGTTAASSRLIHGGLRYLQYGEIDLVRESLRERGLLVRQRPHLVRPIRLLIPAYQGQQPAAWVMGAGLKAYDLLAHDPVFPPSQRLPPAALPRYEPGLSLAGLTDGFLYSDGQVEFPERLCVELTRETRAAGGTALNHTRVTALRTEGSRVTGTSLRDELTGRAWEVEAALTLNAAGPWVDAVNRLLPGTLPRLVGGTWGSHVVLPPREAGPRGPLYALARRDGRPFFLLPWDGRLLVGTTDVPFEGDPDTLRVQDWEVEYLLAETNALFPGCGYTPADVLHTTIGVRPLPASDRSAGAITRRHFLVDHARLHGLQGLGSVVGGKLTTYRSLAEETVDWVFRNLSHPSVPPPCPTRRILRFPSPEEMTDDCEAALARFGAAPGSGARLARLHGPRWPELLERVRQEPELARPLFSGSAALAVEAVHAVETEGARTADDVIRRRLMLLPAPAEAAESVVELCAQRGLSVVKARDRQ